jgi:hypothetical protein
VEVVIQKTKTAQLVFVFLYVYSSIILETRAEQVLPGSKGVGGRGMGQGGGQGEEMAQTMYAHMNK